MNEHGLFIVFFCMRKKLLTILFFIKKINIMAFSIKPEGILRYFAKNVCPFRANYLDNNNQSNYTIFILLKHTKIIIRNTIVGIFLAGFLNFCWRLQLVVERTSTFCLNQTLKFLLWEL